MNGENIKERLRKISQGANAKFRIKRSNSSVGIDISDRSLEVVEIDRKNGSEVVKYNRIILKEGLVKRGNVKSNNTLSEAIKGALSGALPEPIVADTVVLGIPDNLVFSHVFEAKYKDEAELKQIVAKETETSIPIRFKDAIYTYKVLKNWKNEAKEESGKEILIIAASRRAINKWKEIFTNLGINVILTDFEPFANYRAILNEIGDRPICLVDIGNSYTTISVIDKEELYYSYTFNCGGEHFTRKIIDEYAAQNKPIDYETAETIKIQNGLVETEEYASIAKILKMTISSIVEEIKTALIISDERCGCAVDKVILTGGSSGLNNLREYIGEALSVIENEKGEKNITVEIGKPKSFANAEFNTQFMGAVGLAMKGFEGKNQIDFDLEGLGESASEPTADKPQVKEESEANDREDENTADIGKQKKILAAVLIFGLIGMGGALYYRSHQSKTVKQAQTKEINIADNKMSIDLKIAVLTDTDKLVAGKVNGKTVNVTIDKPETYEKVVEYTISIAKMKFGNNLTVYPEPIKLSSKKDSLSFPLDVTWLGYSQKQVESASLDEIKKQVKDKFILDGINIESAGIDDSGMIYLNVKADISKMNTAK